jgi:hypothetical protein
MSRRRTHLAESAPPAPVLMPDSLPARLTIAPVPGLEPPSLTPSRLPPKMKPRAVMLSMPGRCVEKGCVFPEVPGAGGKCIHHQRQMQEPGLYSSHQPSSALVARGKFAPSRIEEIERGEGRGDREDRRRMMAERERFLGE